MIEDPFGAFAEKWQSLAVVRELPDFAHVPADLSALFAPPSESSGATASTVSPP